MTDQREELWNLRKGKLPLHAEPTHHQVAAENKVASTSNFRTEREHDPALEQAWRELENSEDYNEMMRYGRNPGMLRAMFWKAFRIGFQKGNAIGGGGESK